MVKSYGIDINVNNGDITEEKVTNILSEAFSKRGIEVVAVDWKCNWKDMSKYESGEECSSSDL